MSGGAFERFRGVIAGDYRIERELEGSDAARVLLARDCTLDRLVVLKTLLSETPPGAPAARSFLREGRVLARLRHPNVVPVHRALSGEGWVCLVMEYLGSETLADTLAGGALRPNEVVALGKDLLDALAHVHAQGVAHRRLRPSSVYRVGDRYVLAGFGGARALLDSASGPGDPGASDDATPRDDLYAAAAVLYQAATGRSWIGTESRAQWSVVPRRLRPVLRRALAAAPERRWPDTNAFRVALVRSLYHWRVSSLAAVALLAGIGLLASRRIGDPSELRSPGPAGRVLAVLPFEVIGQNGADSIGPELAHLVQLDLDNLPGLSVTSRHQIARWQERQEREPEGTSPADAARALKAHWVAQGLVERRGDSLRVRVSLHDSLGHPTPLAEIPGRVSEFAALGDTLALRLIRTVSPYLEHLYRRDAGLSSVPLDALKAFLRGEAAFARDQWALAERNYEVALSVDSSFGLAEWRLATVRRWRRLPYDENLEALHARVGARLRPSDRQVLEALLERDLARRFARLDAVIAGDTGNAYARLLYGEELYHRGPLVGRPASDGVSLMATAIALDSSLAQAYDHLVTAPIREGNRSAARAALALRRRVSLEPSAGDPDVLTLLELAYDERFVPWRAGLKHRYLALRGDSVRFGGLARVARLGVGWFDIPAGQLALSQLLLEHGPATDSARADAHVGEALALLALGRPVAAATQLDTAAAILPGPELRLQQAEWRVILPAIGVPGVPDAAAARASLETLAADSGAAVRAHWALGLERLAAGDTAGARRHLATLDSVAPGHPLAVLLRAVQAGAAGRPADALAISDSARLALELPALPDPFARAVFHLFRGGWRAALGDAAGADREWLWYEAAEVEGWPQGPPQAGELDAAVGVHARARRWSARLAGARSGVDTATACRALRRVAEIWDGAEPSMDRARSAVRDRLAGCPS